MQDQTQAPDGDFEPNLVNTVCWLVSYVMQLSTFAANYQGEPFNLPIRLNRGLANVLQFGGLLFVILTIDMIPGIAALFSLVRPSALAASGNEALNFMTHQSASFVH